MSCFGCAGRAGCCGMQRSCCCGWNCRRFDKTLSGFKVALLIGTGITLEFAISSVEGFTTFGIATVTSPSVHAFDADSRDRITTEAGTCAGLQTVQAPSTFVTSWRRDELELLRRRVTKGCLLFYLSDNWVLGNR